MDGFFLVDKQIGMTSHDVVRNIKRKFHLDKVGHTGTLDPFASGLLIVCVGKATKLSDLMTAKDKTYQGVLVFGKHYDTYDTTGEVLAESNKKIDKKKLLDAMQSFVGTYEQEPPMYSAIKINGQKLYHLAHQGKVIDREKRKVEIKSFDLIDFKEDTLFFQTKVSKGTYIRSLAVDLSSKLETLGALSALRRISIDTYHISNAHIVDELTTNDFITLDVYFKDYPSIKLNDYMIKLVRNGVYLDERQTDMKQPFIVKNMHEQKVAYYEPLDSKRYRPIIIF